MKPVLAVVAVALIAVVATPAAAAIDVATFIAKANALKAKGPMALFSSDLRLLKRESVASAEALKADKARRKAAGQPPLYCTPEGAKMGAGEFMAGMEAIPVAERGMSLQAGMARMLTAKYPCR